MGQEASSPSGPPQAPEPARASPVAVALAAATFVLLGFVAYWAFAPTTYLATATLLLEPTGSGPLTVPSAPPPAQTLRSAALDTATLAAAMNELGTSAPKRPPRELVEKSLVVERPQPNAFTFTFSAPTAGQSKRIADLCARSAAGQAPALFAPPAPDVNALREAARTRNAAELASFLALHPELAVQSPVVAPVGQKETPDADPAALRVERDQIQAKLARVPEGTQSSDNPFGDPTLAPAEVARMRRRVIEIDTLLKARQKAEKKSDSTPKVAPEVAREWKRLVEAVARPETPVVSTAPPLTATVREAPLPDAPIHPDRHALALLGGAATLFTFAAFALGLSVVGRRGSARGASQSPEPARFGSEPPRADSDAPPDAARIPSEPPRPGSEPPRAGSEPPQASNEAQHRSDPPPRPTSDAPQAGSNPPRPGSDPPRPGATLGLAATQAAARPIVPIGITPVVSAEAQRASSNPPPRASSNPPAGSSSSPPARASSNPPAPTTSVAPRAPAEPSAKVPSRPPAASPTTAQVTAPPPAPAPLDAAPTTAVGLSPPSPPPPPPAPSQPPAEDASGRAGRRVSKETLMGMPPFDPRAVDEPRAGSPETVRGGTPKSDRDAAGQSASSRPSRAPRTTVRPPPSDPKASEEKPLTPEVIPPPDSWTGPSRAHRRSVSARRTTQMLGSPIPPVTRSSRPAPEPRGSSNPPAQPPATPTTYSYVSTRPEEPAARPPTDTPPYYQLPRAEHASLGQTRNDTPRLPTTSAPEAAPPRIVTRRVRDGWIPDPSLDFRARRELCDQLLPFAMEGCFVVAVTAVEEARSAKSRVAAELALALAEPRHPRVLLLEADFQWPAVHRTMRIEMPMSLGFSQQLSSKAEPQTWTVIECSPTLHVLAEGIMRSPGLILSVRFEQSIQSLRSYYDLIVIDGPPAYAEIDARALASAVDGGIVVSPNAGSPDLARACALFAERRFSTVLGV